eukprot:1840400-Rhodomonas_salina.1
MDSERKHIPTYTMLVQFRQDIEDTRLRFVFQHVFAVACNRVRVPLTLNRKSMESFMMRLSVECDNSACESLFSLEDIRTNVTTFRFFTPGIVKNVGRTL